MQKITLTLALIFLSIFSLIGQERNLSYAYLSDTHIAENAKSVEELEACVKEINENDTLKFVIITGDITDFGSDKELTLAKTIFDKLNKPYYIIAGNHDSKWSESGCNSFIKIYGYERFAFEDSGILFVGTNCGPDMRMAPALVPRESIVWLDSLVAATSPTKPIIYFNHYPQNDTELNYFEVLNILKKGNIQLIQGGHYHNNVINDYEGVPGTLGRSTMSNGRLGAGYNIVSIKGKEISISEKNVGQDPMESWYKLTMTEDAPFFSRNNTKSLGVDYSVNKTYSNVKELWTIQENSNIGAGATSNGKNIVYTTTSGYVKCVSPKDGKEIWKFKAGGKIFSTPAIYKKYVVFGCSDNLIYALNIKDGSLIWKHQCDKSVLGSPAIHKNVVYIGASDNRFRALNIKDGSLKWNYPDIKGFIEAKPLVDDEQVVIGDWANTLYSFDTKTGELQWKWYPGKKKNRMYSPAAVWPVKANNKIFIVTPERLTYAIEATSGNTIWSADGGRESIGISTDKSTIYVKTMQGIAIAYDSNKNQATIKWQSDCKTEYEISPTPITAEVPAKDGTGLVFIPTDRGEVIAISNIDGSIVWRHRVSHALINYIQPLEDSQILVTTLDGKVSIIKY